MTTTQIGSKSDQLSNRDAVNRGIRIHIEHDCIYLDKNMNPQTGRSSKQVNLQ